MHNVAVEVLLQMLRISAVVLYTCVFAPLLLLEYNTVRPKLQPKSYNKVQIKKGLLSLPAAPSHAAPYALLLHVFPNSVSSWHSCAHAPP